MAGTFSKDSRPKLPGAYFDFIIQQQPVIQPAVGRIVAVVFTHNWGPLRVGHELFAFADFLDVYRGNPNEPTSGFRAVRQAFQGEDVPGFGGAAAVIAMRMGTASATKATLTLSNTAATPAPAVRIDALYEGTLGNELKVTIQDYPADPTKTEFVLLRGSTVLETYIYDDADLQTLVNEINTGVPSSWVRATLLVGTTPLATVSATALASGNDGATALAPGDYTAALTALESTRFGVLCFEDLTTSTVQTSVKSWAQAQNLAGRRFFTVFGGALNEDVAAATSRAISLNDPDIINIGVGRVEDLADLDAVGVPHTLSTSQLAPRIAGIIANRGESYSLTFAKLPNLRLIGGATASELVRAMDGGTIALTRASDPTAPIRLSGGVTTFINKNDPDRPYAIYSIPRYLAVMHGIQEDLTSWAEESVIGLLTVDDETRAAIIAQLNTFMEARQAIHSVQAGWTVFTDPVPPPSDDVPWVAFVISAKFGRSVEQIYFTVLLG
jgi:hypothetical protein